MADAIPSSEAWRPIVGYEGWYEVSDHGRVRRVAGGMGARVGKVVALGTTNRGYRRVVLHRRRQTKGRLVHHLVLEAFVGPRPAGHECNHKDGDKTNNRPSNLEWVTKSGNAHHAVKLGLWPMNRGEKARHAKLTAAQVVEIRQLAGTISQDEIAARYGVTQRAISFIVRRETWRHVP
jgi:hypothetical protein